MKDTVNKLSQWKSDVLRIGESVSDETWNMPIEAGKWSIREVAGHMLYWDLYLNREGLPAILNSQGIVFPNHDEYNAQSVHYIDGKSKSEIVNEAAEQRDRLLTSLESLSEDRWMIPISINGVLTDNSGNPYTLNGLMLEFVGHDRHHVSQIKAMVTV
ncbi:DinB family protein [Fictibacillus iocasae]|uniref:DinB family protein n=1 Tax=Fictibacillus iocasae TaxID=2715437 RepID=A0ABW2NM22_9BACL